MAPPLPKGVPASVLLALGIGCADKVGPCLSPVVESGLDTDDTDVSPCLGQVLTADTAAPQTTGHTGLEPTETGGDSGVGPCLDFPVPTGHSGGDSGIGPCLSPPLDTAPDTGRTDSGIIGPCLSLPPPQTGDTGATDTGSAPPTPAPRTVVEQLLDGGVLSHDVAERLKKR